MIKVLVRYGFHPLVCVPNIPLVKLGDEATLIRDVENHKKYFALYQINMKLHRIKYQE